MPKVSHHNHSNDEHSNDEHSRIFLREPIKYEKNFNIVI